MNLFKQLKASLVLGWLNGIIPIKRTPFWVISYLMFPLSLLFLLRLYSEELVAFAVLGGFLSIFAYTGIEVLGDVVYFKTVCKIQDMFVASPVSPSAYLFGLALSSLFYSLPGFLLLILISYFYGPLLPQHFPKLLLVLLLVWISFTSLGFTLSTFIREPRHAWPLVGILSILFSVLPPLYYPAALIPPEIRPLSLLIPTGSGAIILQQETGLLHFPRSFVRLAWISLVLQTFLLWAIARYGSRWRER
ncbi:MAG: ABC transporter permease [Candidatus Hadarchaeales archaeon]